MTSPDTAAVPERARVVVVGGGVIGASVAYHLAHLGLPDVVLLERDRLTSGSAWTRCWRCAAEARPSPPIIGGCFRRGL